MANNASDVFFVSLHYRGVSYEVPTQEGEPVSSIFDLVHEVLDFPREYCRLIWKGKVLRMDDPVCVGGNGGLLPGAKLMLVASSAHDVAHVHNSRADPLVKGFEEEERDERNRRKRAREAALASDWGTKQDPEYCFGSIKAEFKYSTPPPYDAEKLLKKLATDPGIIEIMKNHRFKVLVLTEMSPAEAQERMAQKGTPNMDLLGYNQNHGDKIVLKLRTDNVKGFRPYHDLINTLVHELTHNVWGPHDHNFWKLFGELSAEYKRFHRFWSHGGASASGMGTQFGGFNNNADGLEVPEGGVGTILGSQSSHDNFTVQERRASALLAAEARMMQDQDESAIHALCGCGVEHSNVKCPDAIDAGVDDGIADTSHPQNLGSSATASDEAPLPSKTLFEPTEEVPEQAVSVQQTSMVSLLEESVSGTVNENPAGVSFATPAAIGAQVPTLDKMDLIAVGLDGTAEWIESFQTCTAALCASNRPEGYRAAGMLLKLARNAAKNPREQKFRRIRTANPQVRDGLLGVGEEAEVLLKLLGFEPTSEGSENIYLLKDASFDAARLQLGQELLETCLGTQVVN